MYRLVIPIRDMTQASTKYVLGIDLGTRNSCVGVWVSGRFQVIHDVYGNPTIPSVVAFHGSFRLAGQSALATREIRPTNTVYDVKRIIGRRFDDPVIATTQQLLSYQLVDDETSHHNILIQLDNSDTSLCHKTQYKPEEICALILGEIRNMACRTLGQPADTVWPAVVTVPAYFNDAQRQATLDAAEIAGLEVLKIINEPTSAGLAYGLATREWQKSSGNVIIYDFGAGTLDVSLLNIEDATFRVMAVSGNTHLGGEDIDYLIMNHVMRAFRLQHGIPQLTISKLAQMRLKNQVEMAKKLLSTIKNTTICVADFYQGRQLFYQLSRKEFNTVCNHFFIMCLKPLQDVIQSSGLERGDIDDVVLVGGSTRIPKLQALILDVFRGTKISKLMTSLNPDEIVAMGAAIYGYAMVNNEDPFSQNLVLLDITPLSLGVETLQRKMTVLIPRNTVIPTTKSGVFSTDTDNQDSVMIKIFEGERQLTCHNFHVGDFELAGFQSGPRGYPTIKITFSIDINGILQVTAHEKKSGVESSIRITNTWSAKGRMSRQEIDALIQESHQHEAIDKIYAMKVLLVYQINTSCDACLLNLKQPDCHVTEADKKAIRDDITRHQTWLSNQKIQDLAVTDLEARLKAISDNYASLIYTVDKEKANFTDCQDRHTNFTNIHGDDTQESALPYETFINRLDPNHASQELEEIRTAILAMCQNLQEVVNNPVSQFTLEDVQSMTDYVDAVRVWIYAKVTNSTLELVAKINEINTITTELTAKYRDQPVFQRDALSAQDELQMTCMTLSSAIRNNYFSIKKSEIDGLTELINSALTWLATHPDADHSEYRSRLTAIDTACNQIHDATRRYHLGKQPATVADADADADSDCDTTPVSNPVAANNKICENLTEVINCMPDKPTRRRRKSSSSNLSQPEVLLKINPELLIPKNETPSKRKIQYKSVNKA